MPPGRVPTPTAAHPRPRNTCPPAAPVRYGMMWSMIDPLGAAAPPPRPKYLCLQALRALAALAVVAYHVGGPSGFETKLPGGSHLMSWAYPVGALGVDLFFLISGFLMTVTTASVPRGPASAGLFLLRRAFRIYPAYLVITFVIFLVYSWRPDLVNASQGTPPDVLASFLLLPQVGLPLLLVGWTLVYEMYFYLIFAATLLAPKRLFPVILTGWGLLTIVVHSFSPDQLNPYLQLAGSLLNMEFLLGVLVAWACTKKPPAFSPWIPVVVGLMVLVASCAVTLPGELPDGWLRVCAVAGGMAVVMYGLIGLELRGSWRVPRVAVLLGDSSYSIYLVHVPVLKVTALIAAAVVPVAGVLHLAALVAGLAAAVGGGWIYYLVVERPLFRLTNGWLKGWRARTGRRQAVLPE